MMGQDRAAVNREYYDMRITRLLLSASAAGLALGATPAFAQDSAADGANEEEAIIVTARRQNERLQDVPASVAVLSAATLENTGAKNADDFAQLTPGVTIVTGTAEAGDTQINIRGINGARDAESSVALVVDGILKTNTAQLNQVQGTLRQVEILKGPQGALYGRNAAAGAIVLQTLKPKDVLEGGAKVSYANENTWDASAYISTPLGESAGLVVSGSFQHTDGFFRNIFLGNSKTVDDKESFNVDGRLVVKAGDNTEFDVKVRYAEFPQLRQHEAGRLGALFGHQAGPGRRWHLGRLCPLHQRGPAGRSGNGQFVLCHDACQPRLSGKPAGCDRPDPGAVHLRPGQWLDLRALQQHHLRRHPVPAAQPEGLQRRSALGFDR